MANELRFQTTSGVTLYALLRAAGGQVWDVTNTTWAAWSDGDIDDYDVAMTDRSGGYYEATFPSFVAAGVYSVQIRQQAGASPAVSDTILVSGLVAWDGSVVVRINSNLSITAPADMALNSTVAKDATVAKAATAALETSLTTIKGAGWLASTDTLEKIRDAITTNLAVTGTSTSVTSNGFLGRSISLARKATDEPELNSKYSDSDLLVYVEQAYAKVFQEMVRMMDTPPTVPFDITTSGTDAASYVLPPFIGSILAVEGINTNGDRCYLYEPRDILNPVGPGFRVEAGLLTVDRNTIPTASLLRLHYIPSGTARLHEGACTLNVAGTAVTLASSPTAGTLDTHKNAYAGCVLRILSASTNGQTQERLIDSYDNTTRIATLRKALDPIPTGTITYEIAPILDQVLEQVIGIEVARHVLALNGVSNRLKSVTMRYQEVMRQLRLYFSRLNMFKGQRMSADTVDNPRY